MQDDPYEWLEEVEGENALEWVKAQNHLTLDRYQKEPLFCELEEKVLTTLDSQEKLVYPQFVGDDVYNFWRDADHVRGLLRKQPLASYLAGGTEWEEVLCLDRLADEEGENWVYKGQTILAPECERTLLWLSRGGSDACVIREYCLKSKSFVEDGFTLPEAKSDLAWKDRDTLYVGTAFDENAMTKSGYPRVIKLWHRGTPIESAETVLEVDTEDLAASAWVVRREDSKHEFLSRVIDFWNEETFAIVDGEKKLLDLPTDVSLRGFFKGQLLATPRSDWETESQTFTAGSLVAVDLATLLDGAPRYSVLIDALDGQQTIESVNSLKSSVVVGVTENVQTSLHRFRLNDEGWSSTPIEVRSGGAAGVAATSSFRDELFLYHEDFTTPTTLYYCDPEDQLQVIQSLPERFDAEGIVAEQLWVESLDGTRVPYYIVYKEGLPRGDETPALLYGYGGFEVSLLPRYLSLVGISWLERGGIYISANIRGGGEFGPAWHQAALRESRHKAFEDFEAVANDVVQRGFTKPEYLAIHGASNGGLLTGAMLTRRPELFGAVVIGVPLLDMRRYHKLLAGASWMAEYGDPDNEKDWAYLREFSPYHRVEKGKIYPPVLVYTSTKDDRVHPGHARKMVAKLGEYGYRVEYYENLEGGHAGVTNNEQQAFLTALIYTYLWEKLR